MATEPASTDPPTRPRSARGRALTRRRADTQRGDSALPLGVTD